MDKILTLDSKQQEKFQRRKTAPSRDNNRDDRYRSVATKGSTVDQNNSDNDDDYKRYVEPQHQPD